MKFVEKQKLTEKPNLKNKTVKKKIKEKMT